MVNPLNPQYNLASFVEHEQSPSKFVPRESKEIKLEKLEIKPRETNKLDDIPGATKSPRRVWHDHNMPDIKYTPKKEN